jgi:hypothetical protein
MSPYGPGCAKTCPVLREPAVGDLTAILLVGAALRAPYTFPKAGHGSLGPDPQEPLPTGRQPCLLIEVHRPSARQTAKRSALTLLTPPDIVSPIFLRCEISL